MKTSKQIILAIALLAAASLLSGSCNFMQGKKNAEAVLTRHFQTWRRSKKFWSGQYGGQGHDPGLTYPRDRVTVAVRVLPAHRAINEEARLIARLRPRDNLIGQPDAVAEDVVPF